MDPLAVMVFPSFTLRVNQTGVDELCDWPTVGTRRDKKMKMTADSLRIVPSVFDFSNQGRAKRCLEICGRTSKQLRENLYREFIQVIPELEQVGSVRRIYTRRFDESENLHNTRNARPCVIDICEYESANLLSAEPWRILSVKPLWYQSI